MAHEQVLRLTADYAAQFLDTLGDRPIHASASLEELREALGGPLPDVGNEPARATQDVVRRVQEDGTCWLSGTVWQGRTAMRISVSNWQTSEGDVERSVAAILEAAAAAGPARGRASGHPAQVKVTNR